MEGYNWISILAILVNIISVVVAYMIGNRQIKHPTNVEISKKLIDMVFIPYHHSIELNLYKRSNKQNLKRKILILQEFKFYVEEQNLRFYFSNRLLHTLDRMTAYHSEKKYNFLKRFRFNDYYRLFSSEYLQILNKSRKSLGLEKRDLNYRIYNSLFRFPALVPILIKFIVTLAIFIPLSLVLIAFLTRK